MLGVGSHCALLLPPSATSWQVTAPRLEGVVNDVVWTGRRFVAVGRDGLVTASADGAHWSRLPIRLDLDLERVATDGAVILVAGDGASVLRRSLDDVPAPTPDHWLPRSADL